MNSHDPAVPQVQALQREKLQLEIDEKKRKFWTKPSFYFGVVSVLTAFLGVGIQWVLSNHEYQKAENKRILANIEIATVQLEKMRLDEHFAVKQDEYSRLARQVDAFRNAATPLATGKSTVQVKGFVKNSQNDEGISGVKITAFKSGDDTSVIAKTKSNDLGEFVLALEPGGNVVIFLWHAGYRADQFELDVDSGGTIQEFELVRLKSSFDGGTWAIPGMNPKLIEELLRKDEK